MWTWSRGDRGEALHSLIERFNKSQSSSVVRATSWDVDETDGSGVQGALNLLKQVEGSEAVPALIEVPEEILVALVESELARDVGGGYAARLGVRFDDFHPWLMSDRRIVSEGIVGLPLFHEIPVLVFRRGSPLAEKSRQKGFGAFVDSKAGEGAQLEQRQLAAAADYRIFLAFLRSTSALSVQDEQVVLDREKTRSSLHHMENVFVRGLLEPGEEEEAQTLFLRGETEAALMWSSQLGKLGREDIEIVRAPMRTKGTYLVVYGNAAWRSRQSAFRLAQWVSEPLQASDLAAHLWTAPIRKSAARGANYRGSAVASKLGQVVTDADQPIRLPASSEFINTLMTKIEPMLSRGKVNDSLLHHLQRTLETADE